MLIGFGRETDSCWSSGKIRIVDYVRIGVSKQVKINGANLREKNQKGVVWCWNRNSVATTWSTNHCHIPKGGHKCDRMALRQKKRKIESIKNLFPSIFLLSLLILIQLILRRIERLHQWHRLQLIIQRLQCGFRSFLSECWRWLVGGFCGKCTIDDCHLC